MLRIDPISFVATQLGTREVPNLGGIDDADDMTSLVQRARDAETIAPGGFQTGVNPSHPLGDQPIEEMAPPIRGVRKAPCAHLVAARHARVQRVFGNVDTQYPVDHCPILPPCLFSKSSASNNLVRRIYAHARPKIPSNLHSGAWKTGPNLPHGLIRQRDARGSPFSSQLSKMCLFAKQSATYKGRGLLPAPRTGRVEDWRACLGRCSCCPLSRPFVCECHNISTVPRFQPPPRRTQRADFPHCALLFASPQGLWGLSCWGNF